LIRNIVYLSYKLFIYSKYYLYTLVSNNSATINTFLIKLFRSYTVTNKQRRDTMPISFPVNPVARYFRLQVTLNARHECTAIKIFVAISRKQLRARMLDFSFVIGAVPKDTLRTATRRDATRDGLPFRFEGFRSECLGHFQSKPKRGG